MSSLWLVTNSYRNVLVAFSNKQKCVDYLASKPPYMITFSLVQRVYDGKPINHHESPFVRAPEFLERNQR